MIRGLKADKRRESGTRVRDNAPSSRWAVMVSAFDCRPAAFRCFLSLLAVVVIKKRVYQELFDSGPGNSYQGD